MNYALDFLASLYEEEYEHRSINCYRSANSGFHEKIEGLPVGQNPEVCTLQTGVFNLRPSQPSYSSTWDVQIVKNNWTDNKSLPNKSLTLTLTMLLALTSASRASNIHHLDIRFMSLPEEKVVFRFAKSQKLGERVKHLQNLTFLHLRKTRTFV